MNIKFSPPDITEAEIAEVADTLKSGWITTGPKTKLFEREIARYCKTDRAVCLNSATACLELILRVLGIGEGDEVITSAYTYTASASVINHVGAKIVLCDTAKDSFELDYSALANLITERTKAIIAVDYAGVICDYDKIFEAAEAKRGLFNPNNDLQKLFNRCIVIADAAHSFGAVRGTRRSGSIADFTSFSFHAVKNLTTAEGGALTWRTRIGLDNEELYRQFMLLSLHGQSKDALAKTRIGAWEYDIEMCGYKCNMTDIMAAIGLAQLRRYDKLLERRKEIIGLYKQKLCSLPIDMLSHEGVEYRGSMHLFPIRIHGADEEGRNFIITEMAKAEIATNVHYKPLPMHTAYKKLGFDIKDYPNAYAMYRNEMTLPLHTLLTDEMVEYVADTLGKILNGNG